MVCLEGNVLGKLKSPVVFLLKECFCFYFDVSTDHQLSCLVCLLESMRPEAASDSIQVLERGVE